MTSGLWTCASLTATSGGAAAPTRTRNHGAHPVYGGRRAAAEGADHPFSVRVPASDLGDRCGGVGVERVGDVVRRDLCELRVLEVVGPQGQGAGAAAIPTGASRDECGGAMAHGEGSPTRRRPGGVAARLGRALACRSSCWLQLARATRSGLRERAGKPLQIKGLVGTKACQALAEPGSARKPLPGSASRPIRVPASSRLGS
jgi:hypothetical protein